MPSSRPDRPEPRANRSEPGDPLQPRTRSAPSNTRRLTRRTPAPSRALISREEGYAAIDFGLTVLLARAAAASGRPRFVYLSAAGVRESSWNAYARARFEAETAIRESGLPYSIARPSFITGPDRDDPRPWERAGARAVDALLRAARLFGAKRLHDRYRSTTNAELARALVRIALDPAGADRVFESEELRGP